jgi:microcystin-dependent protein
MALHLLNSIANGEVADALPVDANYRQIEDYINTEVITRDGAVQMQAPLQLQGGATEDNSAASKEYVDSFLPVGIMLPWPSPVAPGGGKWMLCNGAALAVASYTELHGILGTRYGSGTGTFLLPNLTGRIPVGLDTNQTELNTIGKYGGTFALPLPAHNHGMAHTHPMPHTHEHNHTHTVNPASVTTGSNGAHTHDVSARNIPTAFSNQELARSAGGTVTSYATSSDGAHTHSVDIPSTTTSAVSEATTSNPSNASTSASSAPNTANEGTANAKHFAPYVVVNYIIRVL